MIRASAFTSATRKREDRQLRFAVLQRDNRLTGKPGAALLDRPNVHWRRAVDAQPLVASGSRRVRRLGLFRRRCLHWFKNSSSACW